MRGLTMWPDFQMRSEAPERMDDRAIVGAELDGALRELRVINRALGSAWPTIEGVERLWRAAGRPQRLAIIDVGAGSGDVGRRLLAWAATRGVDLRITLVDIHPQTCAAARDYFRDEQRVQVVCSDLLSAAIQPADIVTAALFTHHFSAAQLPDVFGAMARAARLGVVVNDLHRHPLAWGAIWLATRLLSRNPMIRNDAPLSVLRGFQPADLERLRAAPGMGGLQYTWRPLFRYLITLPGAAPAAYEGGSDA